MPILFFILSIALLSYTDTEPQCMYGSAVFAVLGILLASVTDDSKHNHSLKNKKK